MGVAACTHSAIFVAFLAAASVSCSPAFNLQDTSDGGCTKKLTWEEDEIMLMQVSLAAIAPSTDDAESLRDNVSFVNSTGKTGVEVGEFARASQAAFEIEKPLNIRVQKTVTKVRAQTHSFEDSQAQAQFFPKALSKKRSSAGEEEDDDDSSNRPFSVNDFIPGSIISGLSNATFRKLAIAINMSIQAIDTKATDLLEACQSFEESMVVAVKRAGDKAFEEVSTRLLAFIDPFMSRWLHVTDAIAGVVPLLVKALVAVGKGSWATPLNKTMAHCLHDASKITEELRNTTNLVNQLAELHNATDKEIDDVMALIDNYTSDGLAEVRDFGETLQTGLLNFISDVAKKLTGVSLPPVGTAKSNAPEGSIEQLVGSLNNEVTSSVESLTKGLDTAFQGVDQAMQEAANQEKSGTPRSAPWHGLFLCAIAAAAAFPSIF